MKNKLMYILSLAIILIGLIPADNVNAASNEIAIVFLVDNSDSGGANTSYYVQEIQQFVNGLDTQSNNYKLGIITFNASIHKYNMTNDLNLFKQYLQTIGQSKYTQRKGFEAVKKSLDFLLDDSISQDATKYIVILTDDASETYKANNLTFEHKLYAGKFKNEGIKFHSFTYAQGLSEYGYISNTSYGNTYTLGQVDIGYTLSTILK